MLVLSRKCGEQIVIGDGIAVAVVAVRGGRVTLGVTAPPEVPIRYGSAIGLRSNP